jgi:hypothetical protein
LSLRQEGKVLRTVHFDAQRKVEGRRAFAASLSNAMLGQRLLLRMDTKAMTLPVALTNIYF